MNNEASEIEVKTSQIKIKWVEVYQIVYFKWVWFIICQLLSSKATGKNVYQSNTIVNLLWILIQKTVKRNLQRNLRTLELFSLDDIEDFAVLFIVLMAL